MKKLTPVIITALVVVVVAFLVIDRAKQLRHVAVLKGNDSRTPVEFVGDHFQGAQCGMVLSQVEDSAQAVAPDGKTWFFDDVGCLALWLEDNKHRDEMVLWVYTRDTREWLDGRLAWYSRTDQTPMNYGFAAFQDQTDDRIAFPDMYAKMLRDENLNNPSTRKELLGNH